MAKLVAVFEAARPGKKYGFQPKDAKAVSALLALGADEEIEARWNRALELGMKWPGTGSLAGLVQKWNDLAAVAGNGVTATQPAAPAESFAGKGGSYGFSNI